MRMLKLIYDVQYTHLLSSYVPKSIKDTEKLGNTWLGKATIALKIAVDFVFCS